MEIIINKVIHKQKKGNNFFFKILYIIFLLILFLLILKFEINRIFIKKNDNFLKENQMVLKENQMVIKENENVTKESQMVIESQMIIKKDYFCCFCAVGRKENRYSRELISYYMSIGVDKFVFIDNNLPDTEKFSDVLQDYIKNGTVDIIEMIGRENFIPNYLEFCMINIKINAIG